MSILEDTEAYESWLGTQCKVVEKDLARKHERMRNSPFVFLRATYYRWARRTSRRSARSWPMRHLPFASATYIWRISGRGAKVARGQRHRACARGTRSSPNPGKDRALALDLKNRILLDNYYLPGDLERQINAFVEHYNHVRYHESLSNLTPADVYFGRADTILAERERIKRATIATRRLQHQLQAA